MAEPGLQSPIEFGEGPDGDEESGGTERKGGNTIYLTLHQYLYEHIYCTDKSRFDCAMVEGRGAEQRREQTAERMLG